MASACRRRWRPAGGAGGCKEKIYSRYSLARWRQKLATITVVDGAGAAGSVREGRRNLNVSRVIREPSACVRAVAAAATGFAGEAIPRIRIC